MTMISLLFLVAVQVTYIMLIQKNNATVLALVLIDGSIISMMITPEGNNTLIALSLFLALALVGALSLIEKGKELYENTSFNRSARPGVSTTFNAQSRKGG